MTAPEPQAIEASRFAGLPGDIAVSFEFFPPKNAEAEAQLSATIGQLAACDPAFVSVTYGACGTAQETSLATLRSLIHETSLPLAAHLTCAGASQADVDAVAERFYAAGVRHIVALRGDARPGDANFQPHPDGYRCAAELVEALALTGRFEISVAAYPEVHPDAASAEADLDNLKRKLDAGATRALTQFFFSPETFFRFRDRAAAAGVSGPIVPGILPITNFTQMSRFARACGTHVPKWLEQVFAGLDDHPGARQLVAASVAAELCSQLYAGGVRDFHFYTLNRPELTQALCHLLGKRVPALAKAA